MEAVVCLISVSMKDSAFQEAQTIADYSEHKVYSVASFTTRDTLAKTLLMEVALI